MGVRKVYVLSSLVMRAKDGDAMFRVRRIKAELARELVKGKEIVSAVGHKAVAKTLTELLGREVEVRKEQVCFEKGDEAIVLDAGGNDLYHVVRVL